MLDLQPAQYDREAQLVDLNPRGRRQTRKYRPVVPVTRTLRSWLEAPPRALWYVAYARRRVLSIKHAMRETRARAKLPETTNGYSFRHGMARELRKRRVPGEQIELMLGHRIPDASSSISALYAPWDPSYCAEAAAAIDDVMAEVQARCERAVLIGPQAIEEARLDDG